MNKGILTVGIIFLSILALLLVNVLSSYSTGSELDYYLVKETTDAAMEDAIDSLFLRECGLYRIDKERFVESFLYRFADSVDSSRDYHIDFYDINEVPPKVSVKVDSLTVLAFNASNGKGVAKKNGVNEESYSDNKAANITTSYDAILETKYLSDLPVEEGLKESDEKSLTYDQCRSLLELDELNAKK